MVPPGSQLGPIETADRQARIAASPLHAVYRTPDDRESAYELLRQRSEQATALAAAAEEQRRQEREQERQERARQRERAQAHRRAEREKERLLLSLAGEAGQRLGGPTGRSIARGLMGGILRRGS